MRDCHRWSPRLEIGVSYLVLVCLHVAMSLLMKGPRIMADEMGYLGNARYLLGKGVMPNMAGTAFYHAGYSILISPAFWLSSDPKRVYSFVLVINGMMISSLFLFLYYWLRHVLVLDHKISVRASLATSFYPPFLLQSNIAWAENALIPLFILPAIFLHLLVKRRSPTMGILFGFSISFLYTVHPRPLLLLLISAFYLIYLVRLGYLPLMIGAISLITLLSTYLVTVSLHEYLRNLGWSAGGTPSITGMVVPLLNIKGLLKTIVLMATELWYLAVATYGLAIAGFFVLALRIWQHRSVLINKETSPEATHAFLFYLLACGGMFLTSVFFMSGLKLNGDRLIYGRYNECFIAAAVGMALGLILQNKFNKKYENTFGLILILVLVGLSLITWGLGAPRVAEPSITGFNVLGLFPVLGFIRYELQLSFSAAISICGLYALGVMLILMLTLKLKRRVGVIILCGSLFLMFAIVQHIGLFLPGAKRVESLVIPGVLKALPDANTVSYDRASQKYVQFYQYQYFLPSTRFILFDSSKNEIPGSDLFLSSRFSGKAQNIEARLVALEKEGDLALWVKKRGYKK
jgi:hypothetical protein